MFIIVGLGNPGSEYQGTRHNLGFAVIDSLAETLKVDLEPAGGEYLIASTKYHQASLSLVKPVTYMNNSGAAVKEIVDAFHVPLTELLVVTDDFHLPLGALRLRLRGGDGGHNGLYSIIYQLHSEEFSRLRCGIAGASLPTDKHKMADYVLAPFEDDEKNIVQSIILRARDATLEASINGVASAMNSVNSVRV